MHALLSMQFNNLISNIVKGLHWKSTQPQLMSSVVGCGSCLQNQGGLLKLQQVLVGPHPAPSQSSLGYPAVLPFYIGGGKNVWAMAFLRVVHSGILYLLQTPTRNTIMRLHTCNLRTCASTVYRGEAQRTVRRGAFG